MAQVTTHTVKVKINNSKRRFDVVAFHEDETSIASDTLQNVDTQTNQSVVTSATMRIGQETVKRKQVQVNIIIEDDSIGVKRIGRVTFLGDSNSAHGVSDFKQGHNVKNILDTTCSMLPHLTINSKLFIDEFGNIDSTFEDTSIVNDGRNKKDEVIDPGGKRDSGKHKNRPFRDYIGRLDPVDYVRKGEYIREYPIINNLIQDYLHYIEPEIAGPAGAIDVLEVRSKKANTNAADLQVKGIRGSFCSGPWDLPSGSTSELRKGTSQIQDKTDIEPYEYDFFEDCQDLVFSDSKFSHAKNNNTNASGYKYSLDGYVSVGKYMSPPFVDKIAKDRAYELRYQNKKNKELQDVIQSNESIRDVSDIGTRFKSSGNGSILRPKYENVIQTILGTDSIAFAGLLRE